MLFRSNGISGLHAVLFGGVYWLLLGGDLVWAALAASLAGAALAFLPWNWGRHARVFLGDSGSYLIGSLVGLLALATLVRSGSVLMALAPVSIYLVDVVVTVFLRVKRGRPLMTAHRDHVYQRLVDAGLAHSTVSVMVAGFSSVACVIALLLADKQAPPVVALAALGLVWAAYLMLRRLRRLGEM